MRLASLFGFAVLSVRIQALCPAGAVQGPAADECYLYSAAQATWYAAEEDCATRSGHLVSIPNGFVNSFLPRSGCSTSGVDTDYWIGASRVIMSATWSWTDGSGNTYSNWANGEPSDNATTQCASLRLWNSLWYAMNCNFVKSYICNVPHTSDNIAPPTARPVTCPICEAVSCPDGWIYYAPARKCYKKVYNLNFYDARSVCQGHGGELASIHSYDQDMFLYEFCETRFQKRVYTLIGLYDPTHSKEPSHNNDWQWTDGTPVEYLAWAGTDPNNAGGIEWCVAMITDVELASDNDNDAYLGKWVDIRCDNAFYAAICELPASMQ